MSKKKKSRSPEFPNKSVLTIVVSIAFCLFLIVALARYLKASEYFKVKTIMIDPALQYINREDLSRYKGANIFAIDLEAVEKRISGKYPQISDLKVVKKYPDQLMLVAKKRMPFIQAKIKGQTVTFDDDGVVLSKASGENKEMAFVQGLGESVSVNLGGVCKDQGLISALGIVKILKSIATLNSYDILSINVGDLSKIELVLNNNLVVYLDQLDISQKLKILSMILSQGQIDLKETNYIDLRFKEPIIGKKENVKSNNKR